MGRSDNKPERNYKFATEMAYKFLIDENVTSFPVDVFEIIKKHKWSITTFEQIANDLNIPYTLLKASLDDAWGTVHYNGINYAIAYDNMLCKSAQYFTILHEIGHIVLEQLTEEGCIKIHANKIIPGNVDVYKKMEDEANCFARNVAVPICLVNELEFDVDEEYISTCFGITPKASKSRLDLASSDRYYLQTINKSKVINNCSNFLSHLPNPLFLDKPQNQQEFLSFFNYC